MTDHDRALVDRLLTGQTDVVAADDPEAVAAAVAAGTGGRVVPAADVATWVAEAEELHRLARRVLGAEEVVAGARAHERSRRGALLDGGSPGPTAPDRDHRRPAPHRWPDLDRGADTDIDPDRTADPGTDRTPDLRADTDSDRTADPDADRDAVRFSLVVLGLAQVGGLAVHLAEGNVLAVALPAVSILGILAVHARHRRPARPRAADPGSGPRPPEAPGRLRTGDAGTSGGAPAHRERSGPPATRPVDLPAPPVVRAAEAHLRRQQAAWKLAWWQRGLRPVDVSAWVGPRRAGDPVATLVVSDPDAAVDPDVVVALTAAVPATVRVVFVGGRRPPRDEG